MVNGGVYCALCKDDNLLSSLSVKNWEQAYWGRREQSCQKSSKVSVAWLAGSMYTLVRKKIAGSFFINGDWRQKESQGRKEETER